MLTRPPDEIKRIMSSNQGVVKVIQSNENDDQHWNFFLPQLAYPAIYRPVHGLQPHCQRNRIYNTETGKWEERKVDASPTDESRGRYKNTRFAKKTAMTLIPADGQMHLFASGSNMGCYIGFLFNKDFISWHGATSRKPKYVFASNAVTNNRWWLHGQPGSTTPWKSTTLEAIIETNIKNRREKTIGYHNEVMGRACREAVSAVFARENYLTPRLNALHKKYLTLEWLKIDVPVCIFTPNNPYQFYTDDQIILDIVDGLKRDKSMPGYRFAKKLLFFIRFYHLALWEQLKPELTKLRETDSWDPYQLLRLGIEEKNNEETLNRLSNSLLASRSKDWLLYSIQQQHREVTRYLLTYHVTRFSLAERTNVLLHALVYRQLDIAELALNHPVNVDAKLENPAINLKNNTALQLVFKLYHPPPKAIVAKLIKGGANPLLANINEKSPFDIAYEAIDTDITSLCIPQLSKKELHLLLVQYAEEGKNAELLQVFHRLKEMKQKENNEEIYKKVSKKVLIDSKEIVSLMFDEKLDATERNKETILTAAVTNEHFDLAEKFICLEEKTPLSLYSDRQLGIVVLTLIDKKKYDLAHLLLNKRPNVNLTTWHFPDSRGNALHLLVSDEKADPVLFQKVLEKHKESLKEENANGDTPLLLAIKKEHDRYVRQLLSDSQKVDYSIEQLEKILTEFINENQRDLIKKLITINPILLKNRVLHNHLFQILSEKTSPDLDYIKLLIPEHEIVPACERSNNVTLLSQMALNNHLETLEYCLNREEKMPLSNYSNDHLGRVLSILVCQKHYSLCHLLFQKRPSLCIDSKEWITDNNVLHILSWEEKPDIRLFQKLLSNGNSAILSDNKKGETPLLIAIKHQRLDTIRLFFDNKSLGLYSNSQAEKILDELASKKQYHYISEFIKTWPLLKSKRIEKIMEYMSYNIAPDIELIKALTIDPVPLTEDKHNNTLLTQAAAKNHVDAVRYLIERDKERKENTPTSLGKALFFLVKNKHYSLALYLLNSPLSIEKHFALSPANKNALHILMAEEKPDLALVKELLPNSGVIAEDNEGQTPFYLAIKHNHTEIFPLFLDSTILERYTERQIEKIIQLLIEMKNSVFLIELLRNHSHRIQPFFSRAFQGLIRTAMVSRVVVSDLLLLPDFPKKLKKEAVMEGVDYVFSNETKEELKSENKNLKPVFFLNLDNHVQDKTFVMELSKKFIKASLTPEDILSLVQQLEQLIKTIPCFTKRPTSKLVAHSFYQWKKESISYQWVKLINQAKNRIAFLLKTNRITQISEEVADFLSLPIQGTLSYAKNLKEFDIIKKTALPS